jgi:hypothetical protein
MLKLPRVNLKRPLTAFIASLFLALQLPLTPIAMRTAFAATPNQNETTQNDDQQCPDKDNPGKVESSTGSVTVDGVNATWTGDPGHVTFTNANTTDATITWCAKGGTDFYGSDKVTDQQSTLVMPGTPVTVNFGTEVSYFIVYSVDVDEDTEVTPGAVTFDDLCGTENDTYTIPTTTGVDYQVSGVTKAADTYDGSGSVTVTAVAQDGFTLTGTTEWSHTFTNVPCDEEEEVTPGAVTFNDECGTEDDTYTIPSTTGVEYQVGGTPKAAGTYPGSGAVTVTAVAEDGFTLTGTTQWSHTFTNTPCEEEEDDKITLCHRTNSNINPYVQITVDTGAADGIAGNSGNQPDHFDEHQGPVWNPTLKAQKIEWGDIIPPIEGVHDGLNWTTEGQLIYNNNCEPADLPEPSPPTVLASIVPCTVNSDTNDSISTSVTNTDDLTEESVAYTISLSSQTKFLNLDDGQTGSVLFDGLTVGSYSAAVSGDDGTSAVSNTVTVAHCPRGQVLGDTTGGRGGAVLGASTLADTGSNVLGNVFAALALIGLTCGLAVTTRRVQYE